MTARHRADESHPRPADIAARLAAEDEFYGRMGAGLAGVSPALPNMAAGLDLAIPGTGQAAQTGIRLANKAIKYAAARVEIDRQYAENMAKLRLGGVR